MIIHVVKSGETVFSIASEYGVTEKSIIDANGLGEALQLAVGQALIIIDSPAPKIGTIGINGYAYDTINSYVLNWTLPYLTYLTIFGYGITPYGGLIPSNDETIIAAARSANVAPMMLLTALTADGHFSTENVSAMLNSESAQDILIENITNVVVEKQYFGVDVDFEYVPPEDMQAYADFVKRLRNALNPLGKVVFVALAPKTSDTQRGLLYEAHNYSLLGAAANYVLLMTYEWGYAYSEPKAVAPIKNVTAVVDYGLTRIPAEKIFMGIPNYGYDWTLPHIQGNRARTISNSEAVDIAVQYGAEIQFDSFAMSPFFNYYDENGTAHEVWFEDARSLDAKFRLIAQKGLYGAGIWNVMKFFQPLWTLSDQLFTVRRVLE